MLQPFYGAARLAFGQNPEVITTSTTTITPLLINNASPTTILQSPEEENETKESDNSSISAELEATKNGERRSLINYKMPPKVNFFFRFFVPFSYYVLRNFYKTKIYIKV